MNYLVEILVEEPSMSHVLSNVLPKVLPEGYELNRNCFIRIFDGKQDLQKHIPQKVRAYKNFSQPVKLIIIQDKDSNDCIQLKQQIRQLIVDNNPTIPHLIRIACTELESWYIGDMAAIEKIYPKFKAARHVNKAKFRNPDACNAYDEIRQLIPSFQKGYASKNIPQYFNVDQNKSLSFNHLINGIQQFLSE
jgi:hypothetical protein